LNERIESPRKEAKKLLRETKAARIRNTKAFLVARSHRKK
jgi:hypothetical protein